jgi:hypothetical protein
MSNYGVDVEFECLRFHDIGEWERLEVVYLIEEETL